MKADDQRTTEQLMLKVENETRTAGGPQQRGRFQNAMAYIKISSSVLSCFKVSIENYISTKIMASLTNKNLQNISFCQVTNFSDGRNKRGSL